MCQHVVVPYCSFHTCGIIHQCVKGLLMGGTNPIHKCRPHHALMHGICLSYVVNLFAQCAGAFPQPFCPVIAAIAYVTSRLVLTMVKRKKDSVSSLAPEVPLLSLGRTAWVSQSGLAGILRDLKHVSLPKASSRATQYRRRKAACAEETPFGRLVQTLTLVGTDTAAVVLAFQHPLAILWKCLGLSQCLRKVLQL